MGLDLADSALKFSHLRLDPAYLLDRCIGAKLLQFRFQLVEFGRHVWNFHANLFHAGSEFFLLFAQGLLLLPEHLLFSSELFLRSPKLAGTLDCRLIANNVRLFVPLKPDKVSRDPLS